MAKKKDKKAEKDQARRDDASAQSAATRAEPGAKMKTKDYEREMRRLHGELVAMQEWVKATGAKVCIVFEGRDTAGKGGTIKRITERVSPRVFKVVALSAPTERETVADVRPAVPAALPGRRRGRDLRPQLVQPRRRRAGHGLLHARADGEVPRAGPGGREGHGRRRDHPGQVLAGGQPRRADAPPRGSHQRPAQDLEADRHGPQVVRPLGRLLAGPGRDVRGDRHAVGAVVHRPHGRQEAGTAQHHQPPAEPGALRAGSSPATSSCRSAR